MKTYIKGSKSELARYSHLGLGDITQYDVSGPFANSIIDRQTGIPTNFFETILSPEYLGFVAKNFLGVDLAPFQCAILYDMWIHPFPMLIGSRGLGKSFLLAIYAILKAILVPGTKVVIVGAAFRQSKFLFEYMTKIWRDSEILRDLCGNDGRQGPHTEPDKCTLVLGDSTVTAIPIGDGQKIRGLRANITICDEFASLSRLIFENVIVGFGVVSQNPMLNVKQRAYEKAMKDQGIEVPNATKESNQIIISGTAYYAFNHFYEYWMQYKRIILSKGDRQKMEEIYPDGVPEGVSWKDYTVIRIPYELIPEGFMDAKQVDRAKATIHASIYGMEYGALFATDSNGFYKRSIIEMCVCKDEVPIRLASGDVYFTASTKGRKDRQYVYGIDPAFANDNFSIVILETYADHRRIVYLWTTNKTHHKHLFKNGLTKEDDYYAFCARKIRDLMVDFPCEAIALDTQGGGYAIQEALASMKHIEHDYEKAILPVIDPDKEQDTDNLPGLHILHLIQFANAEWTNQSNYGMQKDFQDRTLLFPAFDTISIGLAIEDDKRSGRTSNTLEDCILEIEDLKDELASIQHTQTPNGRDKWDTPEIKLAGGKKGRQRKDRYSSLLMANAVARLLSNRPKDKEYVGIGGFVGKVSSNVSGPLMTGPAWYTDPMRGV